MSIFLETLSFRKKESIRKYRVSTFAAVKISRYLSGCPHIKFFLITQIIYNSGKGFYLLSTNMGSIPRKKIPLQELVKKLLHWKFLVEKLTAPLYFIFLTASTCLTYINLFVSDSVRNSSPIIVKNFRSGFFKCTTKESPLYFQCCCALITRHRQ